MKIKLVSLLISVSFLLFSLSLTARELYFFQDGKKVKVTIVKYQGARVNTDCATKPSACKALRAIKKPAKRKPLRVIQGNFAFATCKVNGGNPLILIDKKGNQYEYCSFTDSSVIDAWTLHETSKKMVKSK